ncbi:MAG: hypothetical protein VB071_03250 [Lawsonibacter sp.]|nr:hypothetical protein [Lawsonibacter sp.]
MTAQEMNEIWKLIGSHRPGDKRLQDKQLLKSWYLSLKACEAADVQTAVAEHFRENHFWPDVSEIGKRCPQVFRREERASTVRDNGGQTSQVLVERMEAWHRELREKGLPSLHEALEAGMSLSEWRAGLDAAGIWA